VNFELKVTMPKATPIVFNYDELKANLTTALADYQSRVYTEDNIADAKEDRAKLNKLAKAINDERISREKEYMQPFNTFKEQAKELCDLIDTASSGIKEQLDAFEEKRINEKKERIESLFAEVVSLYDFGFLLSLEQIFNDKWLNKGTTEKTIISEITERCEQIVKDIAVIRKMPRYAFEAEEAYKTCLDLNKALEEGERMASVQEAKSKVVADDDSESYEIAFKATLTKGQAKALSLFCQVNGIKLVQIKE